METEALSTRIIKTTWILSFIIVLSSMPTINGPKIYQPNWKSLDSRSLPLWYDEGKIGIFLYWGVYSVPSYKSAWFWMYWKRGNSSGLPEHPTIIELKKSDVDFMKNNYSTMISNVL
jgi:hypothetical protein